jgi:hypothetical protein
MRIRLDLSQQTLELLDTDDREWAKCSPVQGLRIGRSNINSLSKGLARAGSQKPAIGGIATPDRRGDPPLVDQLMVNDADAATSYGVVSFLFNWTT